MNSFLKWPGGKKWFIRNYNNIFPTKFNSYIEPFLGSAAVFFYLEPSNSILSDTNVELINLYEIMRDFPLKLATIMREHDSKHCKDYYYRIRGAVIDDNIERAAKFLYLNRTCYNGMYRVNKNGEFNVPIGTKTKCAYDVDYFVTYSNLLKNATISSCDFEESICKANSADLLFVDPPYAVDSKKGPFISYNNKLFSWSDQKRLLEVLCAARSRGAYIIATNSSNSQINEMYLQNGFFTTTISRSCVMAASPNKRNETSELLITSFEIAKNHGGVLLD